MDLIGPVRPRAKASSAIELDWRSPRAPSWRSRGSRLWKISQTAPRGKAKFTKAKNNFVK